jgi:hypothetical protein
MANKLMISNLQNRYQRVSMKDIESNKVSSKWKLIKHGVPQGCILGPLLFLICINDFPFSVKKIGIPILFADDTSIIVSNSNPEKFKSNINLVLKETSMWFNSNFLTLNCDKSHFIQFLLKKHKELDLQIIANNSVISNINCTKFLGIYIDSSLSWKNHIMDLSSRLNKAFYAIRAIKPLMSLNAMRMIYHSYVHSILTYGIILG